MNSKTIYSRKATAYARYRWSYAPQAVEAIFQFASRSASLSAADVGAGTGILSRQIAGRTGRLFVIEPNREMLAEAQHTLVGCRNCRLVQASAEATSLSRRSLDLVTVAQAIHWFHPSQARQEFRRILKPGGWLAVLRNYNTDPERSQAIDKILTPANGVSLPQATLNPTPPPAPYYFAPGRWQQMTFPFTFDEDWETFFGALISISFTPNEMHPLFRRFAQAAQDVFDQISQGGRVTVSGETELYIGQVDETG